MFPHAEQMVSQGRPLPTLRCPLVGCARAMSRLGAQQGSLSSLWLSLFTQPTRTRISRQVLELTYSSRAMEPFARELGYNGPPFQWHADRRAVLRAELDAYFAYLYGLSRDE